MYIYGIYAVINTHLNIKLNVIYLQIHLQLFHIYLFCGFHRAFCYVISMSTDFLPASASNAVMLTLLAGRRSNILVCLPRFLFGVPFPSVLLSGLFLEPGLCLVFCNFALRLLISKAAFEVQLSKRCPALPQTRHLRAIKISRQFLRRHTANFVCMLKNMNVQT